MRPPPGLRGERPGHGSHRRGPASDGGRRSAGSSDLPKAARDDPEIAAHGPLSLIASSAGADCRDIIRPEASAITSGRTMISLEEAYHDRKIGRNPSVAA